MNRYFYNRSDFEDEDDRLAAYVQRGIEVCLGICIFLLILAFAQNKDLQDQLADQKAEFKVQQAETKKFSELLAECLNGGGMYDRASGTAYFCDKPLEVQL